MCPLCKWFFVPSWLYVVYVSCIEGFIFSWRFSFGLILFSLYTAGGRTDEQATKAAAGAPQRKSATVAPSDCSIERYPRNLADRHLRQVLRLITIAHFALTTSNGIA